MTELVSRPATMSFPTNGIAVHVQDRVSRTKRVSTATRPGSRIRGQLTPNTPLAAFSPRQAYLLPFEIEPQPRHTARTRLSRHTLIDKLDGLRSRTDSRRRLFFSHRRLSSSHFTTITSRLPLGRLDPPRLASSPAATPEKRSCCRDTRSSCAGPVRRPRDGLGVRRLLLLVFFVVRGGGGVRRPAALPGDMAAPRSVPGPATAASLAGPAPCVRGGSHLPCRSRPRRHHFSTTDREGSQHACVRVVPSSSK